MSNILYVPQMSMYNKQTNELTPQADGNINMMRNTINEWLKHRPDDIFYVLLPRESSFAKKNLGNLGLDKIKPLYFNSYVISARINRFNFPMREFYHLLEDIEIDLIINDVIELSSNFKQMFNISFSSKPKIISNIRHLDDVINHQYIWRVLDGIMQSDLVTILSDTMRNKLAEQIREMIGSCGNIIRKVITFEPSISFDEIIPYTYSARELHADKVIITFPGRLAKGEERRTNWDKFIAAISKLREKRQDFNVYFTDPNNALSESIIIQQDWTKSISKDRHMFLNLLNQTDIIVSLMDVEGFGGISIREALLMDCLPIIPYVHEYKNMAPDETYKGFVNSPIDVDELVSKLDWAIDTVKNNRNYKVYDYNFFGRKFVIEEQFKKLLPKIEELLK